MSQRAVVVAATPHKAAAWISVGWGRGNFDAIPAAAAILSEFIAVKIPKKLKPLFIIYYLRNEPFLDASPNLTFYVDKVRFTKYI
jgi:hypothetical protein